MSREGAVEKLHLLKSAASGTSAIDPVQPREFSLSSIAHRISKFDNSSVLDRNIEDERLLVVASEFFLGYKKCRKGKAGVRSPRS